MVTTEVLHQSIVAADAEQAALNRLKDLIEDQIEGDDGCGLKLVGRHGESVEIPPSALEGFAQLVRYLARGQIVTLTPMSKDLTTQQAADLLNVSRPFLVKLLEQGEIAFIKVGTHRRIRHADLLVYKQRRDAERRARLTELTQLSEDMGLYD